MICENLVSGLDTLQVEFMFNYVYKYSECALLGVLDRDKLSSQSLDDGKKFQYNKNGIQRIMYIMGKKSAFDMTESTSRSQFSDTT